MTDSIATPLPVNDIIVVCRSGQLKEAAVVLSCLPGETLTPLIVIEHAPTSEQEYRGLYADYRSARDERDAVLGGELGKIELVSSGKFTSQDAKALILKVDRKAELLTPYRSWAKHNRLIAGLLRPLTLRRAIFLFDAQPDQFRMIEPTPMEHISDEYFPILRQDIDWIGLLPSSGEGTYSLPGEVYQNLADLSQCAWRMLRPNEPWPNDPIQVPENNLTSFFEGLFLALRSNRPLLAAASEISRDERPRLVDFSTDDQAAKPEEAVLIEVSDDATKLLGVIYAFWNNARLILTPLPELSGIRTAVRKAQEVRSGAAKSRQGEDGETTSGGKGFLSAIHDFFDPAALAGPIAALEKTVSGLITDEAVSRVGDLPLTAVTDGVPYNFVKKSGFDWSKKPIAHVAGDTSLLLLTDLLPEDSPGDFGFNLIFDPGFFTTTETREVLSELRERVSYSLLLNQLASSSVALVTLGSLLPVELAYFNTHGSDDSIVLADMPLPAFKIVQRLSLPTHPIVFNNSCLSWVGVGREFIRCGARGYVGTLWSVDAAQAKNFATQVISRLVHQSMQASTAMLATGIDPADERAYIFVGTGNTRLARSQIDDSTNEKRRSCETASRLFQTAIQSQKYAGIENSSPFAVSLVRLLLEEAESLTNRIDQLWPTADLDRLDLLLCNCEVLLILADKSDGDTARLAALLNQAGPMVDSLALDPNSRAKWDSRILFVSGRMAASVGRTLEAVDLLKRSIDRANTAGDQAGWQYLELSDCYKALGNHEAIDAAKEALKIFQAQPASKENMAGELRAMGKLGQLANRLGNYQEALHYAQDGYQKAIVADDPPEKASFKADEARTYVRMGQYDLAFAAAEEAVKLARHIHNDLMEVSAYGIITQALIGKGDYEQALQKANTGLAQASRRQFQSEVGDFLGDIATIKLRQNDLPGAMTYLERAAELFAQIGQDAKVQKTLEEASEIVTKLNTWDMRYQMMKLEIAIIEGLDRSRRRMITGDFIFSLKASISEAAFAGSAQRLQILQNELNTTLRKRGSQASEQLVFISRVVAMLTNWSQGEKSASQLEAAQLDQISDGGFNLAEFLQTTE